MSRLASSLADGQMVMSSTMSRTMSSTASWPRSKLFQAAIDRVIKGSKNYRIALLLAKKTRRNATVTSSSGEYCETS